VKEAETIEQSQLVKRLAIAFILLMAIIVGYGQSLYFLFDQWMTLDEYSHGPLLLLISLYVIWGKRSLFLHNYTKQSWIWVGLVVIGMLVGIAAQKTERHTIVLISLLITLIGLILTIGGHRLLKQLFLPFTLFLLSIPMPSVISDLTAGMQLVSSIIGAWMIDVSGVPVFLEGNIIELSGYKLMVAEACSGLNYTFALLSLGVIWAYFFKSDIWQKSLLVAATIPIAIITNSLRIAITGILVKYYGIEVAEGFMHEFEGWAVFLVAMLLMIPVVWLLTKTLKERSGLLDSINLEVSVCSNAVSGNQRGMSIPVILSVVLIVLSSVIIASASSEHYYPEREAFETFPSQIGEWSGESRKLSSIHEEVLSADDYLVEDYKNESGTNINVYLAYFAMQTPDKSVHSPLVCLPGGGFNIIERDRLVLHSSVLGSVEVNRLIALRYGEKYLIYYWMQEQGQWILNKYSAKFRNLYNSFMSGRTDGGLVRVMT
jgi:exosortase D (VPLPA-CTERM-specific)